jgi:LPS-assembly protein
MRARTLVFTTLLAVCPTAFKGQILTNSLPPGAQSPAATTTVQIDAASDAQLPNDPSQEMLPVAQPEPPGATGKPVDWKADRETWQGDIVTAFGVKEFHYRDYVLRADKVTYNRKTTELEAEGHVQVLGGPDDVVINADHGDMRLDMHTARFYHVDGSIGVRRAGRTIVYSTPNSFLFTGRVLLQLGEGQYRIVDGTMTNCRLPKPDWQLIARSIQLANQKASTTNAIFKVLGVPLFYLPFLRHPVDDTGRESGLLIPVASNSSVKGFVLGEQYYWAINRSMDMVVGSEYYSKRGWAPNGDFRYKGPGLDHLILRWNALFDRGVEATEYPVPAFSKSAFLRPAFLPAGPTTELVNQGGVDIAAIGRKDFSPDLHAAANVEYLSSYVYRLVFDDNYSQATNSEVASDISLTRARDGRVPSISLDRFQNFASTTDGDEARILHLPNVRYDVLDRPLFTSPLYWGLASSIDHLGRSEPNFHAHNVGRIDIYPHLSLPFEAGGWSIVPEGALRDTFYSSSQIPDLTGANNGVPTVSHDELNRSDVEASVDIRPPALERDFTLSHWNRELRHVIEPEITYRYVGGIGTVERNVLLVDTTDIATDTNQVGYSVTQRFYLRPTETKPCDVTDPATGECPAPPREWASWQISQAFYIDPSFGGALIPNRRNVFDSTLDLSGIAFLTSPRNLSPVISRVRFNAIDNLRVQWDLDYDPKAGRVGADNLFAGYSWGRTTVGIGHSLLNAVDENGTTASITKSQLVQPFLYIGKATSAGFNLAVNGGYDFVQNVLQYAGVQAAYNWNCCGISLGYRRYELGSVGTVTRDESEWLYSITLASFGSAGDIRRANTVFPNPALPPAY